MLTPEVKALALKLLGKEITTVELRLMPYIQYTLMNSKRIDVSRVNSDDRAIMSDWRARGWLDGGASEMSVSKEFWDAMHELLWVSYASA
jgi:hypothetical protein